MRILNKKINDQIAKFKRLDPKRIDEIKESIKEFKKKGNLSTDNIFILLQYFKNHHGPDIIKMLEEEYPGISEIDYIN